MAGFLGRSLVHNFLQDLRDIVLYGTDLRSLGSEEIPFIPGDLREGSFCNKLVQWAQPDVVIHAAGIIRAKRLDDLLSANVTATLRLGEACMGMELPPFFINVGSAAEYGPANDGKPIKETAPCAPQNDYGWSKLLQFRVIESLGQRGIPFLHVRIFNLLGPGLSSSLVAGRLVKQIAHGIRAGMSPIPVRLTDTQAIRDFIDVRDAASIILELGRLYIRHRVLNLASGRPTLIQDLINVAEEVTGIPLQVELEHPGVGADDIMIADISNLKIMLGGRAPKFDLHQTLKMMILHEMQKTK